MKSSSPAQLSAAERILVHVDELPWSAIFRMAIGFLMVPLFSVFFANDDPGWSFVFWFIGVLLGLRLIPAVLRKVLPFSQETNIAWAERRMMAKRSDAYQWRKLLWFGIGLSAYIASSEHFGGTIAALTAFCLIGGGLGLVVSRRRSPTGGAPLAQSEQRD